MRFRRSSIAISIAIGVGSYVGGGPVALAGP